MSTSDQTFKDYSFSQHGEVYKLLENVFTKNGVHYYLIGANARDLHLFKIGERPQRMTYDIDFAVMVPDFDVYDRIFKDLCSLGFKRTAESYRLLYEKTNTIIDLMPYGEIEQNYTVNFTDRKMVLSVLGFKEVGSKTEKIKIEHEGFDVPVTPIEGIFILKLVAWSEKPESRIKDLDDLSLLLQHAWELSQEDAFQYHLDLFDMEDFDQTIVSSKIIGRKMKLILDQNETLKKTIVDLLEMSISEKEKAQNPEVQLAQNMNKTIDEIRKILKAILIGIQE